ncbi:MAG: NAD(P)/FAD-dependent oxidoreductase [Candidatus Neomarinimicrobiota bacterium]|nr:NAD(P)/FAD-dependent oxidoreductase [Candidatus Neomarinimicrobiota bacterium]
MALKSYDCIVIGGGVNGLTTSAILGKAGKKVVLFEKREMVGGLASTEEFAPGFRCNTVLDSVPWFNGSVIADLELENHGLRFEGANITVTTLESVGKELSISSDMDGTRRSIAQFSERDAERWPPFCNKISMLTDFLAPLYKITPPPIPDLDLSAFFSMKPILKPVRKHGREGVVELLRILPMTMIELLDEWFESEPLRGTLASAGIRHLNQGPMAVGTAFNFLHHHVGSGSVCPVQFVSGGTGMLADSLRSAAENAGVEIRTEAEVSSIILENGDASGIALTEGEQLTSTTVVSSLTPHSTFQLVGQQNLAPRFNRRLANIKYRGATARLHLGLKSLPRFTSLDENALKSMVSLSPSLSYLEKASDAAKYGQVSEKPCIEFTIPSLREESFAAAGKHVLSATIQYIPYHSRGSDSITLRQELRNNAITQLENHAPGISNIIEEEYLLTPTDLESKFALTEGNINHGEMMLDQFFFMRPTIDTAQYSTPIENLFLCGPGTHPGGGLHGTSSFNVAMKILKEK